MNNEILMTNAQVLNTWEQFEACEQVAQDRKDFQIEGKLRVIKSHFVRAFIVNDWVWYEIEIQEGSSRGLKILHKWSLHGSLDNAPFQQVVVHKNYKGETFLGIDRIDITKDADSRRAFRMAGMMVTTEVNF